MTRPHTQRRDARLGYAPLLMLISGLALVLAVMEHHPAIQAAALAAAALSSALIFWMFRKD